MKHGILYSIALIFYLITSVAFAQNDRIQYNNQQLFLSGVNLAWMSFANDIGPAPNNFTEFEDFFLAIHDSGGNSVRWWLHTNGTSSPAFNELGYVIGPGAETIQDLKTVLDIAWQREVGVILCLWSFDMLRKSNSTVVKDRNRLMLMDTNYTRAYINNCLIPMVDSLKGHPAIIAWEIFNEPEGMSTEFGWVDIDRVPMSAIQRFVNLCAGAIHRTDTNAFVTNGSVSIKTLSDVTLSASMQKISLEEQRAVAEIIKKKYNFTAPVEDIQIHLNYLATQSNYNYYRDDRLIQAGGDPDGFLDFYSFHYYGSDASISPFVKPAASWNLTKPIVVAEFHMTTNNGIPKQNLYSVLYSNGYAGALSWSWTDNQVSQKSDMLNALRFMWNNYRSSVDVDGISGEWPSVVIKNPVDNAKYSTGAEILIEAEAFDPDGIVVAVSFFYADTVKIGVDSTAPFSILWTGMLDGNYMLRAVAVDDRGNKRTSKKVSIQVGTPPIVRLEAERASRIGANMSIRSDANASGGLFVDVATNAPGTTITWTFDNVAGAGSYEIGFGYNLNYDTPKGQFINVNGSRITELMFDGVIKKWLEKKLNVNLIAGQNTVQMEMSWGWMYVDYLSVPRQVITSVTQEQPLPVRFALHQNYPNPFNPSTVISYQLSVVSNVTLKVYDVLGREVATLVNEIKPAGYYQVEWNSKNHFGQTVASGVYFYRLQAGNFSDIKKMILIR